MIHRLSDKEKDLEETKQKVPPEFVNIDVHSIEQCEPRSVGGKHLALEMAKQLELPKLLKSLGFSDTDAAIALGSIIRRALHPSSERETYKWLSASSGLGELVDFDYSKTSLDKFYQVSDKLLAHKDALEKALEAIEQRFHGFKSTIALYDLTNTYMEGQAKSNSKAVHGVSKEKRKDCALITMVLVMNEHGFLNKTSFLPGNASEPGTLQSMIEALDNHQFLLKPTIVLDAGIATEENLAWLRQNGYTYVVSARQDAPSVELKEQLTAVGDRQDGVKAALMNQTEGDETWLYCESAAKAAVASSMKDTFRTRYEADLLKLSEGLSKAKGRKKYVKVLERIGRLKEKHKRISGCYEVNVISSEDRQKAIAVEWKVIEEKMEEKRQGTIFSELIEQTWMHGHYGSYTMFSEESRMLFDL